MPQATDAAYAPVDPRDLRDSFVRWARVPAGRITNDGPSGTVRRSSSARIARKTGFVRLPNARVVLVSTTGPNASPHVHHRNLRAGTHVILVTG